MGRGSLTATRYHLSVPSVLNGNFFSSFSNNSFASSVVGSSEDLILIVCQFTRAGRVVLGLGLMEVTRVYGRLHVVCRRLSIYNVGHLRNSIKKLLQQLIYVTETVLSVCWSLMREGLLALAICFCRSRNATI